jgi:uncharacterized protein YdhG (YjbR/CyaY superfamily)
VSRRATASDGTTAVDDYIDGFPADVRKVLKKIRTLARKAAPRAEELISYGMPALRQNGILVYYAAFKKHIGLFPPVSGDAEIEQAIAPYAGPKGNLQFRLDEPVPYDLIAKIVALRARQDDEKRSAKRAKRGA